MHLGFTGTQIGMTPWQLVKIAVFIAENKVSEIHVGDCIGADKEFYELVELANKNPDFPPIKTFGHIPNNDSKRAFKKYDVEFAPKPYLDRNHDIVDASDVMIAAPKENEEQQRSGTWATCRYSFKKKKKTIIFFPDGTHKLFNNVFVGEESFFTTKKELLDSL